MTSPPRGKCLLQSFMDRNGVNQSQLSKKTGVSQRSISYYISGKSIMSVDVARVFAKHFECRIEDLFKWND